MVGEGKPVSQTTPSQEDSRPRIPSLDGLRALSIGCVLFGHLLGTAGFLPRKLVHTVGDVGNFGVRCFFIISGFLITTLLLREWEKHGRVSLRQFYIRRALRIFPAFYAFLGGIALLWALGLTQLPAQDLWRAATYTINYLSAEERSWHLGHIWSLSVEEQFYLVWPATMVLLGPRRALWGALLVVLTLPWVRFATWAWFPEHLSGIKWEFHTVCDALATGCLLAGCRGVLDRSSLAVYVRRSVWPAVVFLLALALNAYMSGRPRLNFLVAQSVMNGAIACFIYASISEPQTILGRMLNRPLMVKLGVLSYSLYLWQQLFLNRQGTWIINSFPLNVVLAIACAWVSHKWIESPFLRLKDRFVERRQPVAEASLAAQALQ